MLLGYLSALGQTSCMRPVHVDAAKATKATPRTDPGITDELGRQVDEQYRAVTDFKATALMSVALGQSGKTPVKRYPDVRGFILFRKPSDIRMMGLDLLVGQRVFDMVSDGTDFRLSVPSRKQFVVGKEAATSLSKDRFANIRPRHLLEVILPKPVDPAAETASVQELANRDGYILHLSRSVQAGNGRPTRNLWIDAVTLHVAREQIFSDAGAILTDSQFSEWKQSDNVIFPMHIEIDRPQEEYHMTIQIFAVEINRGLSDKTFVLEQPAGAQRVSLNDPD